MAAQKPVKLTIPPSSNGAEFQQFQTGDTIDPEHGGTGKALTDLSGQAGKYVKVNSGETGYEFDTPAGGGGGDSLGTGFISGGGSGTVPFASVAETDDGAGLVASMSFFGQTTPISGINLFGFRADNGDNQASMGFTNDDGLGFGMEFTDGINSTRQSYQTGATVTIIGDGSFGSVLLQNAVGLRLDGSDNSFYYQYDNSAYVMANDRRIPDVGTAKKLIQNGPSQYTTTQRDALSPSAGWMIYNTTVNKLQCYDGTTWQNLW